MSRRAERRQGRSVSASAPAQMGRCERLVVLESIHGAAEPGPGRSEGTVHPVPVFVLDCLAVDRQAKGTRLGAALLQDAVKRAIGVPADAGIRALLVHALFERARQFHVPHGFQASTLRPDLDDAPAVRVRLSGARRGVGSRGTVLNVEAVCPERDSRSRRCYRHCRAREIRQGIGPTGQSSRRRSDRSRWCCVWRVSHPPDGQWQRSVHRIARWVGRTRDVR